MDVHARFWLPIVIGVVAFPALVHYALQNATGTQLKQVSDAATFDGTVPWIVPSVIMGFLIGTLVGVVLLWASRPHQN